MGESLHLRREAGGRRGRGGVPPLQDFLKHLLIAFEEDQRINDILWKQ